MTSDPQHDILNLENLLESVREIALGRNEGESDTFESETRNLIKNHIRQIVNNLQTTGEVDNE